MTTIQTPIVETPAIELGRSTWRKRILPMDGKLNYHGRKLHFTRDYLNNMVESFKRSAFPAVPFQLADADNRHTNDPERTRGEIVGLETADDGLWATVSLSDDGAKLVAEYPNLSVSARFLESYERGDGERYPVALQHVLGTWDPRVSDNPPWQQVEAASQHEQVIDLSRSTYESPAVDGGTEVKESAMADNGLTQDEIAQFRQLLSLITDSDDADDADQTESSGQTETGELTDAELDALVAEAFHDDVEDAGEDVAELDIDEPVAVAASNTAGGGVELANSDDARTVELSNQVAELRAQLDTSNFEKERDQLVQSGIPPAVVNLARPLLEGSRTIELANGNEVDAGQVMRQVLDEIGKQATVNLSGPSGSMNTGGDSDEDAERRALIEAHRAQSRI